MFDELVLIGTKNCSRCEMVKNILKNKNLSYQYKLFDNMEEKEQNFLLEQSRKIGNMSFPILYKNEKVLTLQEI